MYLLLVLAPSLHIAEDELSVRIYFLSLTPPLSIAEDEVSV